MSLELHKKSSLKCLVKSLTDSWTKQWTLPILNYIAKQMMNHSKIKSNDLLTNIFYKKTNEYPTTSSVIVNPPCDSM